MRKHTGTLPGLVTTKELAGLLGVTSRWLQQLRKDGVIETAERGKWLFAETVQRYMASLKKSAADETDTNAQRARLLKEQADRTAMENSVTRDELVPVGEVEQALQSTLVDLVQFLDSLGSRVAGQLPSGQAQQAKSLIDGEIEKARRDLVARWETIPNPQLEDGSDDPATGEDAGSVGGSK